MMERSREASVWERVRAASACAPEPQVREEPECKPVVHNKTPTQRAGVTVSGPLPLLILLVILLRR